MYSTDQGSTWSTYSNPVHIGAGQVVHLKSISSDGILESRIVVVADECSDCYASVGSSVEFVDSGSNGNNDTSTSLGSADQESTDTVSASNLAFDLASSMRVMIQMDKNFDHGIDCSLGDWGLCYTKTLMIDYLGGADYGNK
jgi:hypothetical protein